MPRPSKHKLESRKQAEEIQDQDAGSISPLFSVSSLFKETRECKDRIIVHQGGTSCFAGNTLVMSGGELKEIKDIRQGDQVVTFNEKTALPEYRKVNDVYSYKNEKRTVRIRLKNGREIVCTDDHQFFFNGQWTPVSEIIKIKDLKHG